MRTVRVDTFRSYLGPAELAKQALVVCVVTRPHPRTTRREGFDHEHSCVGRYGSFALRTQHITKRELEHAYDWHSQVVQ